MSGYIFYRYSLRKMVKLFANSGDPDQKPHSAASDLGLHCLPVTHLGVSSLQCVTHVKPTCSNIRISDLGIQIFSIITVESDHTVYMQYGTFLRYV